MRTDDQRLTDFGEVGARLQTGDEYRDGDRHP